ncbi:MAG: hypothetical protein OQK23_00985, partial [Rhodospirillales bacterium]|nr:hypothetical protein [Rhodospirillales bacterium]MCW8951394.1 hypothetical protein [Rhodospirillales bacterium]MCW8969805.1 hypothetical protein [Rhodospirillales bacterium]
MNARSPAKRFSAAAGALLLLVMLGACGAAPRPFAVSNNGSDALPPPGGPVLVRVEAAKSLNTETARVLTESMAEALKQMEIPATTMLTAAPAHRLIAMADGKDGFAWQAFDTSGRLIGTVARPLSSDDT